MPSGGGRAAISKKVLVVQIVFLAIALLLGGFVWTKRAGAEAAAGPSRVAGSRPRIAAKVGKPAASAAAPAAPSAVPEPIAAPDTAEKGKEDEELDKALDAAKVGPGGVLFQPEGHYRSPFANPKNGGPITVKVGFLLGAVRNYDIKLGTFEADFQLALWSDRPMPDIDLAFTNGKVDQATKLADKPTFKLHRFLGTFNSPPDLRHYPFDQQELQIEIEEDTSGTDTIRFEPVQEFTNLDAGFHVIGWDVSYVEARTLSHYFPDRWPTDDLYYQQYIFRLGIERFGTSAIFTVYVPAIVIVLISLMGMWVPPNEMEVRSNAGAPMLAAAVLFHFALIQALPATPYLTRADKLMVAVYVALFLGMISTWFFFVVDERHWDRVFRIARATVPPVTVAIIVAACVL
jgi:hypothetical protein